MSLRRDVHMAFDAIAPATGGMAERIVETARREAPRRFGSEGTMFRVRMPMPLVAVFVVIALVAAVLVAGRLVMGWNTTDNAGPTFESQLDELRAKPVQLAVLKVGDPCPWGPGADAPGTASAGGALGESPIWGYVGNGVAPPGSELDEPVMLTASGAYFAFNILTRPEFAGPILVRGRDLQDNRTLLFPGAYSDAESVAHLMAEPTEFVIDTRQRPHYVNDAGLKIWYTVAALAGNQPDCVGFQVDTSSFSEVFVFQFVGARGTT